MGGQLVWETSQRGGIRSAGAGACPPAPTLAGAPCLLPRSPHVAHWSLQPAVQLQQLSGVSVQPLVNEAVPLGLGAGGLAGHQPPPWGLAAGCQWLAGAGAAPATLPHCSPSPDASAHHPTTGRLLGILAVKHALPGGLGRLFEGELQHRCASLWLQPLPGSGAAQALSHVSRTRPLPLPVPAAHGCGSQRRRRRAPSPARCRLVASPLELPPLALPPARLQVPAAAARVAGQPAAAAAGAAM